MGSGTSVIVKSLDINGIIYIGRIARVASPF